MVSRDLDSLINAREAAAVKVWLASDKVKGAYINDVTCTEGCKFIDDYKLHRLNYTKKYHLNNTDKLNK